MALLCALPLLLAACERFEGDQAVPAYLAIDSISVANTPGSSASQLQGYFTSLIDCAEVTVYVKGDTAQTSLGVYELPCCVPLLRAGVIDRVLVSPVVKQNGIAATHIAYPYYTAIELSDVVAAPDDTTRLGSLVTHYNAKGRCAWQEFFEPGAQGLELDSVVQRLLYNQPGGIDTILADNGCGVIHVSAEQTTLDFWSKDTIDLSHYGADSYLYLEMDYWTDFRLSVGMKAPIMQGGAPAVKSAMVLRPNQGWHKIYINLGRLWGQFGHNPAPRLYFSVLNSGRQAGNVYLDNMKLLVI